MFKNEKHYENEKKRKKKLIVLLALPVFLIVLSVGLIAAFYSDFFTQSGDITSGTLKINGSYTYYLNGAETQKDNFKSLNPGDVIVVKGTITNTGSQSAWIREMIGFSSSDEAILNYLTVFEGEYAQSAFAPGAELPAAPLELLPQGYAVSANKVINGYGANAETESGGTFTYIGSNTYDFTVTVYFAHTAANETQGKAFNLSVTTQALQFRNNNASEPVDTAWAAVTAAP